MCENVSGLFDSVFVCVSSCECFDRVCHSVRLYVYLKTVFASPLCVLVHVCFRLLCVFVFCSFACVCVFGVRVKTHDMEEAQRERERQICNTDTCAMSRVCNQNESRSHSYS